MEKLFVPYQPSLDMKELGFDGPCLAKYQKVPENAGHQLQLLQKKINCNRLDTAISAPLYQQAFRWFREKYGLYADIYRNGVKFNACIEDLITGNSKETVTDNGVEYEEAELECLKKLIEIVKEKQHDESPHTKTFRTPSSDYNSRGGYRK